MLNTDETNLYAGPFCCCGDYSCPASANPSAACVNREDHVDPFFDFDGDGDPMDT